jgi:chromosome partitioning protein
MPIHKLMQVRVLGIDVESVEIGTYQILEHSNTPEEAIISSAPNVWVIPAHIDLVAIEIELVDKENANTC